MNFKIFRSLITIFLIFNVSSFVSAEENFQNDIIQLVQNRLEDFPPRLEDALIEQVPDVSEADDLAEPILEEELSDGPPDGPPIDEPPIDAPPMDDPSGLEENPDEDYSDFSEGDSDFNEYRDSEEFSDFSREDFPSGGSEEEYKQEPVARGVGSGELSMKESKEPTMDIDFLDVRDMNLLDVLKLISMKSGINIVATSNVQGVVSIYLQNTNVLEVLEIITESNGWALDKSQEIIKIMTMDEYQKKYGTPSGKKTETRIIKLLYVNAEEIWVILEQLKSDAGKVMYDAKSKTLVLVDELEKLDRMEEVINMMDVALTTKTFDLSYAKAEGVASKIIEVVTPVIGIVKSDIRSNRIVVSDTDEKIREIAKIIKAFDKKDREVNVSAKIIQVVLSDEYRMGIDWQAMADDVHMLDFASDFDVLSTNEKRGRISVGTLTADQYSATIEALRTVGITDLLSSPSITTLNNQEAKILVGSTEPYVTTTTTTPASGPTTTAETINFIEVGVKLYVTPTIHHDDFITMKIKPEVSSVTSTLSTSNNNTIPIVETSEAETTVMVKNRVTIVIGGLIKDEVVKVQKKVPLMGDIPLFGNFFRSSNDSKTKTETIIFLTPTIITGDKNTPELKRISDPNPRYFNKKRMRRDRFIEKAYRESF